eukprot:14820-Heterococcus_DN1.PRE.8
MKVSRAYAILGRVCAQQLRYSAALTNICHDALHLAGMSRCGGILHCAYRNTPSLRENTSQLQAPLRH